VPCSLQREGTQALLASGGLAYSLTLRGLRCIMRSLSSHQEIPENPTGTSQKKAPPLCHEGWDRRALPLMLKREVKSKTVCSILRQPTLQQETRGCRETDHDRQTGAPFKGQGRIRQLAEAAGGHM
jgi:hypothetical protein